MKVQFFIKKCRKEKTNMNKKDLIDYLSDIPSIDNFDSLVIKKGFLFLNKLKSVCL